MIVPNAVDTVGAKYDVLDQAEPDSVDFEILGQSGKTFVVSGGAVTSNGSATNVAVSALVAVIDGVVYSVNAAASLAIPSAPVDKRFDLVVARVSAGVASFFVIQGANSSTNPTFPKSRTVITTTFDASTNYDPATDLVLGALYRPGSSVVTDNRIIDKRVFTKTVVATQGSAAPSAGTATAGALYYRTGTPSGTSSRLYIGGTDTNWTELAANPSGTTGPYVPIGGIIMWGPGALPTGFLDCDGNLYSTTTYSALFALWGYTFGGSGGSFGTLNLNNNKTPKGTTTTITGQATSVGQNVGTDSQTLTVANMPVHDHTMNHDHPPTTVQASGFAGGVGATLARDASGGSTSGWGGSQSYVGPVEGSGGAPITADPPAYTGNTGQAGSGTAFDNRPASTFVRFIVRAL